MAIAFDCSSLRADIAEMFAEIHSGKNYHENIRDIAMHLAKTGLVGKDTIIGSIIPPVLMPPRLSRIDTSRCSQR